MRGKLLPKLIVPGPDRNLDSISDCEDAALRDGCPDCGAAWSELLAVQYRAGANRRIAVTCTEGHTRLYGTWGSREPSARIRGANTARDKSKSWEAPYGHWSSPWKPGRVETIQGPGA